MAVLEKIRSKGVLVICIVGFAMLAFIIGDFLTSSSSILNASRDVVAEINGEKIHYDEWQSMIDQFTEVYKIESGKSNLEDADYEQIRAQVWNMLVMNQLLSKECDELGIVVSNDELSDNIIGRNPHPLIQRSRLFAGQDGQFNPQMPTQLANYLEAGLQEGDDPEQYEMLQKAYKYYEYVVRLSLLQEKYASFIAKATGANKLEAKAAYEGHKTQATALYVMQPYSAVADSKVTVTDEEIEALYNKRKHTMRQDPTRSVDYVVFQVTPSKADFAAVEKTIRGLKAEFDSTPDIKALVNANSDVQYTGIAYSQESVPAEYKDFAFSNGAGAVTPVQLINGSYSTARIVEAGILSPDSVRLYHIVLANAPQARVDSVMKALSDSSNSNFAALAKKYSAVQQTAAKGGEIGWMTENQLEEDMRDSAWHHAVGHPFTVKQGKNTQIFLVTETSAPILKVKLAILTQLVTAGNQTTSEIYNRAKQFAADNQGGDFAAAAKKAKLVVMPAEGLNQGSVGVGSVGHSREVVRWAFNEDTQVGDISDVYDCTDCYVVATLKAANDDKYASLEEATPALKAELIRDKKAELMIAGMKKYASVEAAAAGLHVSADTARMVNFNSNSLGNAGFEPAVIGRISVTKAGQTTAPIKGNNGVFLARVLTVAPTGAKYDQKQETAQLDMRASYYTAQAAMQYLYQQANIKDHRCLFY